VDRRALARVPGEAGVLKAHSRLFEHLMLAGDLLLIALCWVLAYGVRFHLMTAPGLPPFRDYALQLVPILLVWGFSFRAFDLYRPSRLGSYLSEWLDVAKASTLGVLVLVAIMTFAFRGYEYSRVAIAFFWAASIVAVSFSRAVFREALRVARRRGYNQRYAIVVGGGEPAAEVLGVLKRRPDVGIRVLGLLSDKADAPGLDAPRLGGLDEIRSVLDRQQVDIVFIALPHGDYPRLSAVLNDIGDDPVAIHFVPDVFGLASLRGGVEEFETIPFIHLRESPLYGWNLVLKRGFDLAFGSAALLAAVPVMLLVAVGLKLMSPGPVLYRQERMGVDGRRFRMLKFRTMRVDAERETGPVWARPDDPRRTGFGAFLRRWSLDELPQLWNVLKGEMSLVGPRPERPSFVEQFRRRVPGYMLRHKVKAGITGWAQVNGWRGDTSIEKRIEYDLYYIERWSLTFDLKILLQTFWYGFRNRNAY
jgi:Undecaprenyl-phosphate glucose phosphotransferase